MSGALRDIAIAERREAERKQEAFEVPRTAVAGGQVSAAHAAIMKMRANLDRMIVDGLLQANINSFADLQDREAKEAAAGLAAALNEAVRYIRQPEIGLRTDLPLLDEHPTEEGIPG